MQSERMGPAPRSGDVGGRMMRNRGGGDGGDRAMRDRGDRDRSGIRDGRRGGDMDRGYRRGGGGYAPWRSGRRYSWGPGFYFYNGYYYGDCGWLRRRAVATGSSYWWDRYRLCRATW